MIGYMIEQELGNLLPFEQPFATILTMVEVDPGDPAFGQPTKPIGPVYTEEQARRLASKHGWSVKAEGEEWRRVVPSPLPRRIFEIRPLRWLLERGVLVICAGGGGLPPLDRPAVEGVKSLEDHAHDFASGSMGPKVEAACAFVEETGRPAAIGALADLEGIAAGKAGTRIEEDPGKEP